MDGPAAKMARFEDLPFKKRCIDTVRILAADMVEKANSGHPGAPMGCAPIAFVLFTRIMKYSPSNPFWYDRDRFVLSNGHACALLYTMVSFAFSLTNYSVIY
jgi:transketolase